MTFDAFLARLDGVTGRDGQWHARCPAADHNDRNASLSVSVGRNGAIMLTCWAGCSLEAIAAGAGVTVRDLFPSNGSRPMTLAQAASSVGLPSERELTRYGERLLRDTALLAAALEHKGWTKALMAARGLGAIGKRIAIPVRDASGELVNLLRYSVDGSQKPKMLAEAGRSRTPYYALLDNDGPVLVVEGEADAISVAAAGLSAIGVPGVSAKARAEWLEPVRGRVLVVCMDNDDAGRGASRRWAPVALEVGREARVVEWTGRPDKYDVGDLVREHRDEPGEARRILLELAETSPLAPSRAGEVTGRGLDAADDTSVGRIRRVLFSDAANTRDGSAIVREPVPGTGGLLWRGIAHTLFGDRGEGKSLATLIATVSAAAQGERVLYLDRENGPALMRSHVEGMLVAHHDWPDVLESGQWEGRHYPAFDRNWEPADVAEAIAGLGFTGTVFDSTREVLSELGGEPNSDADYSLMMRVLVTPLIQRGLWVVTLDNTGHQEKHRPKGAGAKGDAIPIIYRVRATRPFTPDRLGEMELVCTRSRYGDQDLRWTIELGDGVFGVPVACEHPLAGDDDAKQRADFLGGIRAALVQERPLGERRLLERVPGASTEKRRRWLGEAAADPNDPIFHGRQGYDLAQPLLTTEISQPSPTDLAPRPLIEARANQAGQPEARGANNVDDHELVDRLKDEFDAVELDPLDTLDDGPTPWRQR